MQTEYCLRNSSFWKTSNGTAVCGAAFLADTTDLLSTNALLSRIQNCESVSELQAFVEDLQGHYALIRDIGDKTVLAVDHARSIPLFYTTSGEKVGDSARAILSEIDQTEFDTLSEAEYLLTSYVTGSDTLHPSLKQVEAGEITVIDKETGKIQTHHHFEYIPGEETSTVKKLQQAIELAISRLCVYADGRPIFVLLSGGCDSRIILTELIKQDYESVTALSFGRPDTDDVATSEWVAEVMDIDRKYVEYGTQMWHDWFHSAERVEYYELANNLDSVPGFQAGPALSKLRSEGEVPDDAVFVSGQTIASIGEHLPRTGFQSREGLAEFILDHHYDLWKHDDRLTDILRTRIDDRLEETSSADDLAPVYEHWEWKERQSKFMSQDGLIYSFWGYDWWFPLFDQHFANIWGNLPADLRRGKSALETIMEDQFRATCEDSLNEPSKNRQPIEYIKEVVSRSPIKRAAKPMYHQYNRIYGSHSHPLACEGILHESQRRKYYSGKESLYSYRVMHATGRMSFDPPNDHGVPKDGVISLDTIPQQS